MRFPRADDVELTTAIRRYVVAGDGKIKRYLHLLGGNFTRTMSEGERAAFLQALHTPAREISDKELEALLESEWRSRLTASWLIAIGRRERFRGWLAELLLASELVYAGEGYCLALARFGTDQDAAVLAAYLDRYPAAQYAYNQDWALGALLHIDQVRGSSHAAEYSASDWPQAAPVGTFCALLDSGAGRPSTESQADD
ncbi:MAG TPA: DUF6000 family protein [Actinocrinis sp.]|uniref:DUF6000 family protein n=1 Tax=Actinocrinis sp. TaxID=1920516 RepID=UPI002DDCCE1E|nr:DUF6000 family protein [Actinocrinis sp.]HEV3172483.1 DUF6000 family protein [Actinocrinis sp.]